MIKPNRIAHQYLAYADRWGTRPVQTSPEEIRAYLEKERSRNEESEQRDAQKKRKTSEEADKSTYGNEQEPTRKKKKKKNVGCVISLL
jgi:hypothetical protein